MGWKQIGTPRVVRSDAALAQQFKDMLACPHDRLMKASIMEMLRRESEAGTFRTCEWAKCKCHETAQTYRINGKHTSTFIAGLNGSTSYPFVLLTEFEADTLADVADLYRTFDDKSSSRTSSDIIAIYSAASPVLKVLPRRILQLAASGMAFAAKEEQYAKVPAYKRAEALLEFPGFPEWLHELLGATRDAGEPMKKLGVAAAMFKTWSKSQKDSSEFWSEVKEGSGTRATSPSRELQRAIWRFATKSGTGARTGKTMLSPRAWMIYSLQAWNYYRTKTEGKLQFKVGMKTPAVK